MTEYGGMRFGSYLPEYLEVFVVSGIAVTFFLGGYWGLARAGSTPSGWCWRRCWSPSSSGCARCRAFAMTS